MDFFIQENYLENKYMGQYFCEFCGYEMDIDDLYGCPNCNGDGLGDAVVPPIPEIIGMAIMQSTMLEAA